MTTTVASSALTGASLPMEGIEDALAAVLVSGTYVTVTYSDGGNTYTFEVNSTTLQTLLGTLKLGGLPGLVSGRYYDMRRVIPGLSTNTVAISINVMYALPFYAIKGESYSNISCEITVSGAAGKLIRAGIYAFTHATAYPGALIQDVGTTPADAVAGVKDIALAPWVVPATGHYFLVALSDGTPTMRTGGSGATPVWGVSAPATSISYGWTVAQTYGALPDPFTGGGAALATNTMWIGLKAT